MLQEQIKLLKDKFNDQLKEGLFFSNLTTVGIGGKVACFIEAKTPEAIKEIISFTTKHNIPFFVMGGGSNLLVSDEGLDELVIKLALAGIEKRDTLIKVWAGTPLQDLVDFSIKESLLGINKMIGIPR